MSRLGINTGSNPNDGQGDTLRTAMGKINSNFTEIYNVIGDGNTLTSYASTAGISTLAQNLTGSPRINVSGILNTGITTTEHIEVRNITSTGVITATQFVGDGGQLTNVSATWDGVDVLDENVRKGVAKELNFGEGLYCSSPDGVGRVTIAVTTSIVSGGGTGGTPLEITNQNVPLGNFSKLNFGTNLLAYANVAAGIVTVTTASGLNVSGVSTFNNVVVGGSTTALVVNGDARITGILTIGTSSLTLDGSNNQIKIGTGATIKESGSASFAQGINVSGTITATSFVGNGSGLTNLPISGIATYANNAGVSSYSNLSGIATYATTSGISSYSPLSGVSTYATIAGYSTSSGIATSATSASYATIAGYSTSSGIATNATYATTSGYATTAGIATNATSASYATIAGYSTSSGVSTSATTAGYATTAGISTTSQGLTGTPNISVSILTAGSAVVGSAVTINNGGIRSAGVVTASSFVRSGGTSSQFLKADGSVDSSTYLTSYTEVDTLNSVTGRGNTTANGISVGVLTATSLVRSGGTSSQFLKADGSVDSSTYATQSYVGLATAGLLSNTGSASSLTGLTGASANTYGNSTSTPQIVVDANGRITSITNVLISGGGGGGTSVIIQNNGSLVGSAGTINFATGLSVSPLSAGIVTVTSTSGVATYAASSGIATYATIAGYSTSSGLSTSSSYATIAGYSTSSGVSTSATTAGYATTAGISTLAQGLTGTPNISVGSLTATSGVIGSGVTIQQTGIIASGIITGSSFRPSSGYYQSPNGTNAFYVFDTSGDVSFQGKIVTNYIRSNSNVNPTITVSDLDLQFARNVTISGITTSTGGFVGNLTGTATTSTTAGYATTAGIATNATSASYATIAGYSTSSGVSTSATTAGYALTAGISTSSSYAIIAGYSTSSGISTYSTSSGISTSVIGGISSVTQLSVSGVSTFNGSVGIGTTNAQGSLQIGTGVTIYGSSGNATFSGVVTATSFQSLSAGTPTIDSPNNININAVTVAISTDATVGRELRVAGITTINAGGMRVAGIVTITGGLNAPGNYYVKLARTSNQTIPNGTDTLIGFTASSDTNGWYSGITTRTTPTIAGTYQVQVMLNWQAGATTNANQSNIQLRKNGNTFAISVVGIQTFQYSQFICGIVTMNGSTDYIEFTAYTSNATSQVVTGEAGGLYTKMEIFKLN